MSSTVLLSVAERFALTLDLLCRAVAARSFRQAMTEAMIRLVWTRVRRVEGTIQRLLVRFQQGRLTVRKPGAVRSGGDRRRRAVAVALPRGFAWLLPMVPGEAACYGSQLRAMLAEPEMVALLTAAPQARRVLAPLCRMLGIEREVLAPGGEGSSSFLKKRTKKLSFAWPVRSGKIRPHRMKVFLLLFLQKKKSFLKLPALTSSKTPKSDGVVSLTGPPHRLSYS